MSTNCNLPLLSILIPTYNRAKCLDFNLNHLVTQINDNLKTKVEIIISDNCSTDHTSEVIKNYEKYPFITFLKTKENIGADLNFIKLIEHGKGRFFWIFGDDEVLYSNGLHKVVTILENNQNLGLLHITQFGHHVLEDFNPNDIHENPEMETFSDSSLFLEKVSYNLSFITSNIFNVTYYDEKITPTMTFFGTNLIQQTFYLHAALAAKNNIFLTDRIFSQLLNNTGSYRLFNVFGSNQQKIFVYFKKFGLQNKTIEKVNNDLLKLFFPQFILLAGQKTVDNKAVFIQEPIFKILFSNFKNYKYFWIYCVPPLLFPAKLRFQLYTYIRNIKRNLKNVSHKRAGIYCDK